LTAALILVTTLKLTTCATAHEAKGAVCGGAEAVASSEAASKLET
jgi:hypothetical protein